MTEPKKEHKNGLSVILASKSFMNFLHIHSLNDMDTNLEKLVIWFFNAKWSRNDPKLELLNVNQQVAQNNVFDILR